MAVGRFELSLIRIIGEGRRGADSTGSNSKRRRFRPAVVLTGTMVDEELNGIKVVGVASVASTAIGEFLAGISCPFFPL